jgi:hypothetical protein
MLMDYKKQSYEQFHEFYRGIIGTLRFLAFVHYHTEPGQDFFYLKEKFCKEYEPSVNPNDFKVMNHGAIIIALYGCLVHTMEYLEKFKETDPNGSDFFDEIKRKLNSYILLNFRKNFNVYKPQPNHFSDKEKLENMRFDLAKSNQKFPQYEIIEIEKEKEKEKLQISVYECLKKLRNAIAHGHYQVNIEDNKLIFHNENNNQSKTKITHVFSTSPYHIFDFIDCYSRFIGSEVLPKIKKQLGMTL